MKTPVATAPRRASGGTATSLWLLLWALYTTQFIGASFLQTGLTGILRDGGAQLSTLSALQLLGLAWPLKFLWAPLLDRWPLRARSGHHRSWVILLQTLMVLSLLGLALIGDPMGGLTAVVALAAAFVLFSATQDVAADALSVRGLPASRHDAGAGVQVAASYIGTVIGGGLALWVYDLWGWRAAVLLLVLFTAAAMIPVLRYEEPQREAAASGRLRLSDMFGVLAQPGARTWGLIAVPLVSLGSAAMWSLVTPALVDAGWSLTRIGVVTSVVASVPALGAGLLGGVLCGRWGKAPTMVLGAAIQLTGGLSLMPAITAHPAVPAPAASILAAVGACLVLSGYTVMNTGIYAVNLNLSRPSHAGADFTLLTSISMLAGTIGAWAGLLTASVTGYGMAAASGLAAVAVGIAVCRHHQARWGRAVRERS
ncbi:MFS transporter [Kocuria coralli]|uniref:MFS transporter n=1 Tax=Kocuria coralli TaxID=1461025 RepID=A0A5J5KX23_9MICC|nr:MFS transporter [Kocuria coralli]KAA9394042.1 MFS transporter [Kocuria coralli]